MLNILLLHITKITYEGGETLMGTIVSTLSTIFMRMSHAEIRSRAEMILKAMTSMSETLQPWPPFIATIAQLQAVYEKFAQADDGAQTGNFLKQAERNAIRPELNVVLTEIGDYMELGAKKDASLLLKTGFDVRPAKRAATAGRTALVAPVKFALKHGKDRGTIMVTMNKVQAAKCYEFHIASGDPTREENWKYYGVSGKCSKLLEGFEPGKDIWVRARAVGSDSTGPWTNPTPIMPV
jgi:hypothetical protein